MKRNNVSWLLVALLTLVLCFLPMGVVASTTHDPQGAHL